MRQLTASLRGSGGLALFSQSWIPDGPPRAAVALVHGFGEHSGRYGNVVSRLVPDGYAIHGYDLRGHGRSDGQRGRILSWDEYRDDTRLYLEAVRSLHPGVPVFLYGHSLGALIVLEFVLHDEPLLTGVVASGSLLGPPGISPFLVQLSRLLSAVAPRFALQAGLDATALSRDPAVARAYRDDPLVHGQASARLGVEIFRAVDRCQQNASRLRLPLLMLHGADDRLAPPEAARRFFRDVASGDKTFLDLPGGYHEPHNDVEQAQVLARVEGWLADHR